jgi:hypothetical protein
MVKGKKEREKKTKCCLKVISHRYDAKKKKTSKTGNDVI